ncbi:MAG: hypothetical protein JW940_13215 [Polyangiaceae bacterium]|nr:hypothetical protein [Polyangiaceae bacterium]
MPDALRQLLPRWLVPALQRWLSAELTTLVIVVSLALLVGSALAVPWLARRLPADYLLVTRRPAPSAGAAHPYRLLLRVTKNLLGAVLLLLGVAMLVLPGQGLLTMALGLVLLDFPGRRKAVRAVLGLAPVLGGLNRLRNRAGLPPLETPRKGDGS